LHSSALRAVVLGLSLSYGVSSLTADTSQVYESATLMFNNEEFELVKDDYLSIVNLVERAILMQSQLFIWESVISN